VPVANTQGASFITDFQEGCHYNSVTGVSWIEPDDPQSAETRAVTSVRARDGYSKILLK
jgi:hypothetical protein